MKLRASWRRFLLPRCAGFPAYISGAYWGHLIFPSHGLAGSREAEGGIGSSGERVLDALEKLNILPPWPLP